MQLKLRPIYFKKVVTRGLAAGLQIANPSHMNTEQQTHVKLWVSFGGEFVSND